MRIGGLCGWLGVVALVSGSLACGSDETESATTTSASTSSGLGGSGGSGGNTATGGTGGGGTGGSATGGVGSVGGSGGSSSGGGAHLWSKRFGAGSGDDGKSVAVDGSGNVVITGRFRDSVDFGGGLLTSAGSADIILAKYDGAGNHLWSKRFGTGMADDGKSVVIDASGNVLITGYVWGTAVDLGGGPLPPTNIFLAKYDAAGNHVWSKGFGTAGSASDSGKSVAVDGSGNVVFTGYFTNVANFGGGQLASTGDRDIFLVKYDAAGNHLWSKRFGDWNEDRGLRIAIDGSGNVYLVAYANGTIDFGSGPLAYAGNVLVKYDAAGTHLWTKNFGPGVYPYLAVDTSGDLAVAGGFIGSHDFGGGPLISAGDHDMFLAKYDGAGNHLWSERFGAGGRDVSGSVAVDGSGNIVVAGRFEETVDFGGGPLTSAGDADMFFAKYDAAGNHSWSQRFGSLYDEVFGYVAFDSTGNVFATGRFRDSVDFGGGPLVSAGDSDIFLAKYAP